MALGSYPQTLDWTGKACQGQTFQLITYMNKLRKKKSYNIGPEEGDIINERHKKFIMFHSLGKLKNNFFLK